MWQYFGIFLLAFVIADCGPKNRKSLPTNESTWHVTLNEDLEKSDSVRAPTKAALAVVFHDLDRDAGQVAGYIEISKNPLGTAITHYNIYWGKNESEKLNKTPLASLRKEDSDLSFRLEENFELPNEATHILVYTAHGNTEMATGIFTRIADQGSPTGGILTAGFTDTDSDAGEIAGSVSLSPQPHSQNTAPFFSLYWGRDMFTRSSEMLIDKIPNLGKSSTIRVPADTKVPDDTGYLLIFSEDSKGRGNLSFAIPIIDTGLPENAAVSVTFSDTDSRGGFLGGKVVISRASNEKDITSYRIYLGENSEFKLGPLPVAELPATGKNPEWSFPPDYQRPPEATHLIVKTANKGGEMLAGISTLIVDAGLPESTPSYITFSDASLEAGRLSGKIAVGSASDEQDITHYNLYWGTSQTEKGSLIASFPKSGPLTMDLDTLIPDRSTYFLVFSANMNGEMTEGISALFYDKGLPEHLSGPVTFVDTNSAAGLLGGTMTVSRAADEKNITGYNVYWGRDAATKHSENPLIALNKKFDLTYTIPENLSIPSDATHFLVYSSNSDGEMAKSTPFLIDDFGLPENMAQGYTFNDADLDINVLSGTINIIPPADESDITQYNIYWADSSGTKLFNTPVATVDKATPSFTFPAPAATNGATAFLIISKNEDGEMLTGFFQDFVDRIVPLENAVSIDFSDESSSYLSISGPVTLTVDPSKETSGHITHYRLYLSNSETTKPLPDSVYIDRKSRDEKNESNLITFSVPGTLLNGMTHLVAISENNGVEKSSGIGKLIAKVAPPQFAPAEGTYSSSQTVTITTATEGDPDAPVIYYTLDGSEPTRASQVYDGPLTVDSSMVVKAIAIMADDSLIDSATSGASYTISP